MTESSANQASPNPDALDASVRLARLRRKMFAQLEVTKIAQYHVTRRIGDGGMGLVFAAWDPSLDRLVAIKVLRDPGSSNAGTRLRREAVALARLRHPNVVSVFEVGEHEGQFYLAMEYVQGETLRDWIKRWRAAPKPDLARITQLFVEAARGLAAAHDAGVVHRDVKPENVMVDEDGRARLMDFGLARPDDSQDVTIDPERPASPLPPGRTVSEAGLFGTPAYMAPEQFSNAAVGPRADQFGLAACLFEALYGKRVRPSVMAGAAAVATDPIALPSDRRVPRRLCAVLERALAQDPNDRWPSMASFASALDDVQRSRRRNIVLASGAGLAMLAGIAGFALRSGDDPSCAAGPSELQGVWDADRKEQLGATIADLDARFAPAAWERASASLDTYAAGWVDDHRRACEATHVTGEISQQHMDTRMACLRDRRRHLGALVEVIEAQGTDALARAATSIRELPATSQCNDADYVARQGYLRAAPTTEAVANLLARAVALQSSGHHAEARDAATAAVDAARLNEDTVGEARGWLTAGRSRAALYESSAARDDLIEAYEFARSEGLLDVAAQAAVELVTVCAVDLSNHEEGLWWARIAALEEAGSGDPRLRISRELATASALYSAGRIKDALQRTAAAQDLVDASGPNGQSASGSSRLALARLRMDAGEIAAGAAEARLAADELAAELGPDHPAGAKAEDLLARAARLTGEPHISLKHANRALELSQSAVGPDHIALDHRLRRIAEAQHYADDPDGALATLDRAAGLHQPHPLADSQLAQIHALRGFVLSDRDPEGSLQGYSRALELAQESLGNSHRRTIRYMAQKGEALGRSGRRTDAMDTVNAALLIGQTLLGEDHAEVANIHRTLAMQLHREQLEAKALAHHQRALSIFEKLFPPDSYMLLSDNTNVCGGFMMLMKPAEALPYCERARGIGEATPWLSARERADLHNNLGGVLAQLGRISEARPELEEARKAWREAMGPRSYEESLVIANLGKVAEHLGELEEAAGYYREALSIREERLGPEHPAVEVPRAGLQRVTKLSAAQ